MSSEQPIHLRPTAEPAERVLLPGDPGRALMLAQLLLDGPLMFNHHRGLWGYTGTAADGGALTIQSTGMGGPSAAIVLHELIALGVRRAVRVGTCGALHPDLRLGDLVLAREAIAADGTSAALGAGRTAPADRALTDALAEQLRRRSRPHRAGRIVSSDLFYESDAPACEPDAPACEPDVPCGRGRRAARAGGRRSWDADGAVAVEMEAAALFALGAARGVAVGCLLAVSDTFDAYGRRTRIDDRALRQAAESMGAVAVAALAGAARTACR